MFYIAPRIEACRGRPEAKEGSNKMLTVSRWEPLRDLATIQNRLNRMFGDPMTYGNAEEVGPWAPPVDVIEEPDRLVFRAEIPGVSKDDIDVKVENGTLVLRGEKKQVSENDN